MRHPRADDPMVDPPADLREMANRTQFLMPEGQVMTKWLGLERVAGGVVDLGKVGRKVSFWALYFWGARTLPSRAR